MGVGVRSTWEALTEGPVPRLHRKGAELPVVSKELLAPGLVTNLWGRNAVV